MIAIQELTDEQLQRAVYGLRLAGFVPESEFYAQVIIAALPGEVADLSKSCNAVTERFFEAMRERQLPEL